MITDLTPFSAIIYPDRFYDEGYDATLADLISHVLAGEAPILESLLVQRIARAHGFQKAGRLIRERVLELVDRHHHLRADPVGGQFVWINDDAPTQWSQYRLPASDDHSRRIEEIAFEELRAASLVGQAGDVPVEIARMFGIRRLASASRERLEAVLKSGVIDPGE